MIDLKLEQARRRLLDLTRRNRLLNFKSRGKRSLDLAGQSPESVYERLVTDQRTLELRSTEQLPPATSSGQSSADGASGDGAPGDRASGGSAEEAASDESDGVGPNSTRSDRWLATALGREALEGRLLHLAREAESALQEQGSNILYAAVGLLEWTESESSRVTSLAPLILVPVELVRRDITQRYRIKLFDEEPVANPALAELCQRQFQLELPPFDPEAPEAAAEYLEQIERKLGDIPGWKLHRQTHLGLYSFVKLMMYRDLAPSNWPEESPIRDHPLVQRLCGLPAKLADPGPLLAPQELDEKVPPHDCYQVLDADSSQQAAILAAKNGASMVIEGPPGTGKSQTITNIIAECLAEGKTVLFVAEKAAALEVVKSRLDGVGLGDFALEMHSRKASKRAILEELGRVLNSDYPPDGQETFDADELKALRDELNGYVKLLHRPIDPLEWTLHQAMGRCALLDSAPEAPITLGAMGQWDPQRLKEAEAIVSRLSHVMKRLGPPQQHPWRGVGLNHLPLPVRQQLPGHLNDLREAVQRVQRYGGQVAELIGADPPARRRDATGLVETVKAILEAPELPAAAIVDSRWNVLPADAARLIDTGRRIGQLRGELAGRWKTSAEQVDWSPVLHRRTEQAGSWRRWLLPSWHRDQRLIRTHAEQPPAGEPLLADLKRQIELQALRGELEQSRHQAAELFGSLWQGEQSDWEQVAAYGQALVRLRQLVLQQRADERCLARLAGPAARQDLDAAARQFVSACNDMLEKRRAVQQMLRLDLAEFLGEDHESDPLPRWLERLDQCLQSPQTLQDWADAVQQFQASRQARIDSFLDWTFSGGQQFDPQQWPAAFRRQFHRLWVDWALQQMPELRQHGGAELSRLVQRFHQCDQRWLEVSRSRLVAHVAERRPQSNYTASRNSRLGILQTEIRKRRNIKPIRQLLAQVGDVIQAVKPCFMMSPISVAQYFEPGKLDFDVVIFDEASQVEPADALGAVARGKQLILVGDEKQLPPTNFFNAVDSSDEQEEDDESLATGDLESILAVGQVCLPLKSTLRWHYRSRHPSLIEFSNDQFYDRQLRIFPSPHYSRQALGLGLEYLAGATYLRGKGRYNPQEALAVAQAVMQHAMDHAGHSDPPSLGVGAFSMAQQRAIEDEVERLRRANSDPQVEAFFNPGREEPFFVKNLETIQGDERDVILLSVGYGPDEHGKLYMNFGPLNREGGWRRLNVLVTRSRRRCRVFSSIKADALRIEPNSPRGVVALKDYLYFAEHGTLPVVGGPGGHHDSPFEQDVCQTLLQAGWQVHAQVGCAGFSIDLAVIDPDAPGRYLVGIECDGATYHSAATARDRDRLRQQVLEGLGWKLLRIWSTDWFHRRQNTRDELLNQLQKLYDTARWQRQTRSRPNGADHQPPREPDGDADEDADEVGNENGDENEIDQPPPANRQPPNSDQPHTPQARAIHHQQVPAGQWQENRSEVINQVLEQIDEPAVEDDSSGLPPGMVAYQRYNGPVKGDRNRLLSTPVKHLARLLHEIVQVEGPIHIDELLRRATACYETRTGGKARQRLETALQQALKRGQLACHDRFLWPADMTQPPVRWRGDDEAVKAADLIAVEEVAEAAGWLVKHEFGIPLDDLPTQTIRALGFARVAHQLAQLGNDAVQYAIRTGLIRSDASGYMVPP